MFLSVNRSDYDEDSPLIEASLSLATSPMLSVFLGGRVVERAIKADDREGYANCYTKEVVYSEKEEGVEEWKIKTEELRGQVSFGIRYDLEEVYNPAPLEREGYTISPLHTLEVVAAYAFIRGFNWSDVVAQNDTKVKVEVIVANPSELLYARKMIEYFAMEGEVHVPENIHFTDLSDPEQRISVNERKFVHFNRNPDDFYVHTVLALQKMLPKKDVLREFIKL